MKTQIFTKAIHTWIICIIVLLSACQKETSESPLEGLVPTHDTTTLVSPPLDTLDLTGNPVLTPRVSGTWNIDLTGFRYVYQKNVMQQYNLDSKYSNSGYCGYPKYVGTQVEALLGNKLCGLASFLMAMSLVPHDTRVTIPTTNFDKAIRLCELMKRYKLFDPYYLLGGYTAIATLATLANGKTGVKGEFTNWGNCSEIKRTATELNTQPKTNSGRSLMKSFIRTHIQNDHPVMVIISIDGSKKDAYESGYIKTSGGTGHMVVITGVTEDDLNGIYKVRFKDPYTNSSQTYQVDYTLFLNSMIAYTTYYNALAFVGQ